MKYVVQDNFKAQTKQGAIELQIGQVITLSKEKALKLLGEGKITPVERVAYKVYSEPLQAYLWVVADTEEMTALRSEGITEPVYTHKDIAEILKLPGPKEALKTIHETKKQFENSYIVSVWHGYRKKGGKENGDGRRQKSSSRD